MIRKAFKFLIPARKPTAWDAPDYFTRREAHQERWSGDTDYKSHLGAWSRYR